MSAGSPSTTDVAWVPEGPKEGETVTPDPGLGLGEGGGQGGVGGLGGGVGHQVDGAALEAPAGRAVKARPQRARSADDKAGGGAHPGRAGAPVGAAGCEGVSVHGGNFNAPGLLSPSGLVMNRRTGTPGRDRPCSEALRGGGAVRARREGPVAGDAEAGLRGPPGPPAWPSRNGPSGPPARCARRPGASSSRSRPPPGRRRTRGGGRAEVLAGCGPSRWRTRTSSSWRVSTRNCVPPMRAMTSFLRNVTARARATACSAASPAWWPRRSLSCCTLPTSTKSACTGALLAVGELQQLGARRDEPAPVLEPGELVAPRQLQQARAQLLELAHGQASGQVVQDAARLRCAALVAEMQHGHLDLHVAAVAPAQAGHADGGSRPLPLGHGDAPAWVLLVDQPVAVPGRRSPRRSCRAWRRRPGWPP